jgi:hypothetical protein
MGRWSTTIRLAALLVALLLAIPGCGGASASPSPAEASPSPTTPGAASSSARATASAATCPNPVEFGGACLGYLAAGTYSTELFEAGLTYTVPDGWGNFEDLPGNFLLVPPGGELEGVNADTTDFIGVYDGVAAASANCDEVPEPDVGAGSESMAEWYASHAGLSMTEPHAVTMGGLEGVVTDITLAEGYTETCPFSASGEPLVPLIIGTGPAGLHHVVTGSFTARLYLLAARTGEIIAIEVIDHPGGETLDQLTEVVESMEFGR